MSPRTIALLISRENYPVVQAILPLGFLNVPPHVAFGHYLVLNEIVLKYDVGGTATGMSYENAWYNEKDFHDLYNTNVDGYDHNGFFEVELATSR